MNHERGRIEREDPRARARSCPVRDSTARYRAPREGAPLLTPFRWVILLVALATLAATSVDGPVLARTGNMWLAGLGTRIITPERGQWLSGYGANRPATGTRHDLWVKALALKDARGNRAVVVTSDLVGLSKEMYERLVRACGERYGLRRDQVMLTYTHNHCAPVTTNVLPDYYPFGDEEWRSVDVYTRWLEEKFIDAISEALHDLQPATLSASEGTADFAVNRRNNKEAEVSDLIARNALEGPVDHSVPVLAVRDPKGALRAVVFGYACHPTTLNDLQWCGDYPGYAMLEVQKAHPGAVAMFWTGSGGDQNPLPRRSVELCEKYGRHLAHGVEEALGKKPRTLTPELRTSMELITLDFDRMPGKEELQREFDSTNSVRARWARRMVKELEAGREHPNSVPYGVQAWRLGDQLWIALGGEALVDYSLQFKREYGPGTWVAGYAHDMVGYVPSKRVWREGGYEAEFIYEYGWRAFRWSEDTEDRIAAAVSRLPAVREAKPIP